eukprot:3860947-Rhodomonas_salina.1
MLANWRSPIPPGGGGGAPPPEGALLANCPPEGARGMEPNWFPPPRGMEANWWAMSCVQRSTKKRHAQQLSKQAGLNA